MNKKLLLSGVFIFTFILLTPISYAQTPAQTGGTSSDPYQVPKYNTDYSDYYNFAKTRLFDNQEFFGLNDQGSAPGGAGTPANNSTCPGKGNYDLSTTGTGTNYGDPNCNFDKNAFYAILQKQDPTNADRWFYHIVPCESSYNPNAYLKASTSGKGAYGLFQMNPKGQGNGQYDAGNVEWHDQTTNAITYNKGLGGTFAYWACRFN